MAMNVPESAGITSEGEELIKRCVSDVLNLAAQIVAHPNVSKRTCRGNIRRWSRHQHHVAPAEAITSAMAARIVNFLVILVSEGLFLSFPYRLFFFVFVLLPFIRIYGVGQGHIFRF